MCVCVFSINGLKNIFLVVFLRLFDIFRQRQLGHQRCQPAKNNLHWTWRLIQIFSAPKMMIDIDC